MKEMNYDEFKAAICANCKDKEPVCYKGIFYDCNYDCSLYDAYGIYLHILNEINTLEDKYNDAVSAKEYYEGEVVELEIEYSQLANLEPDNGIYDEVYELLREAEHYRAYSYHLERKINEKRKEITPPMDLAKLYKHLI